MSEVFCCCCCIHHSSFLHSSGRVGQDPVPEDGDPGADAGQVGLGAPDAPADDTAEEPAAILSPDDQRTAGVALKV